MIFVLLICISLFILCVYYSLRASDIVIMADVNANNLPVAHIQNSQSMTMSITVSLVELAVLRERSTVVDTFFSAQPVNNIDDVISEDGLMITFPFTMSNIVTPEMGKQIIQLLAKMLLYKITLRST